ncbi:BON domain-containing protein [Dasania sp. GY-MA-18]|uniref:BON domain-containing protein n=1 Tax=Dasania phycosphaerae TaxID=2950436 RepID=A0A9J6RP80_9GAMM|nr:MULTISPECIES: BON domain-containing protein [Dasania]MCR8923704.1 BON domain-containing protein [Dasania sp. GY-MA-18]MCZ0866138.1 BON domain-containing protein [Dasania phycosphaerae]MCZ0869862.1 BON domain-containing protein [Dasania phycosphaerae]
MFRTISLFILILLTLNLQGCSKIISMTTDGPLDQDEGERTTGSVIEDEIIETKILVNLDKTDPQLAQSNISVTCYNGVVLLTGQVRDESLRQMAANVANDIRKVRKVHNEISVSGAISMVARSNDTWITTKLKSKMLIQPKIQGGRIKVVTENGTVYLMGLLTREEGARVADLARQTGGVQKVVILFEYIS